jgi:hypothetical protein
MVIRFWGQNSRLQSVAYQGEASETDLDMTVMREGAIAPMSFYTNIPGKNQPSDNYDTDKNSLQSTFSIDKDLEMTMLLLTLWRIIQGDKSRLFRANEYFYGKVVVKFSWRWVQLKSSSTHTWYLGLQLYFSHPNWLTYYFPSPTQKQLLCL